ncbi:hypothetical protein NQ024_03040 [Corynebacterium sp. 35RC1]|nr:hypothetical protein [Corynebacterium sp. 35RC1]
MTAHLDQQASPEDSVVTLRSGTTYCFGVLISPTKVLTVRHFLRELPPGLPILVGTQRIRATPIPGTEVSDLVVLRLSRPIQLRRYPYVSTRWLLPGMRISMVSQKGLLRGIAVLMWPLQLSRNWRTRTYPSVSVVHNRKAIKGDSGSPMLQGWEILGLQSMILDPAGINIGLATCALVAPHRGKLLGY